MNAFSHWTLPAKIAAVILLAGWVVCIAVNWPGHLSYDSILQLLQGRTGRYNTWHPPVMAWLLGLGDRIVPGGGLFVALDATLAFGALLAVLALAPGRAGWPAVAVALAAALSPQLAIYPGIVWKDVLFAAAGVAGFACLAHAVARWEQPRARAILLSAAILLVCLAALARQNGLVVLPFACGAAGWVAWRRSASRLRGGAVGIGLFLASFLIVFVAKSALEARSDGESGPAEQFRVLQIYDLAGAIAQDRDFPLAALSADNHELADALRQESPRFYTPVRNDPLLSAPAMQAPLGNVDDEALGADWWTLVLHHTELYLRVRADDFYWLLFTPDIVACRPIFTGIEGPAAEMKALGLAPRRDGRDFALERYGKAFLNTPVLSHIPFALIAMGSIILLLRRGRPADIAMAAMLGAALAFTASFFAIAISCDYRYVYALDLSAIAALLYLALDPKSAREGTP